jgi:hypothetical protein
MRDVPRIRAAPELAGAPLPFPPSLIRCYELICTQLGRTASAGNSEIRGKLDMNCQVGRRVDHDVESRHPRRGAPRKDLKPCQYPLSRDGNS